MKLKSKTSRRKFVLPTTYTEPRTELADYSFWIYGVPKIGKTSLTTQFDRPLHFLFENGAKSQRVRPVRPKRWQDVSGWLDAMEDDRTFGTLVLDTVEAMYDKCWRWAQKQKGWEHPSDEPYGKGWASVSEPFIRELSRVLDIDHAGAILLSHAKRGTRKIGDGEEIEDIHPNVSGKALEAVSGAVDVIGYYHTRRGRRVLQIRPTDDVMAGCRIEENFLFMDGSPITYIPMGDSKVEAYANFLAAFNNELDKPEPEVKRKTKLKRKRG